MKPWLVAAGLLVAGAVHADSARDALKLLAQGQSLFDKGEYAAAREAFAQAHDRTPDKPEPYRWLGLTDAKLGRCADALFELSAFLKQVAPNDPRAIEAVAVRDQCKEELQAPKGTLRVESTPAGAEVRLDDERGALLGHTPFASETVRAGNHVVWLRKAGFVAASKPVAVPARGAARVELTLQPLPPELGAVVIESTPPGAEVRLDDENAPLLGRTPLRNDKIQPGSHVVFLRKPEFLGMSRGFTVRAGESARLALTLQPVPPPAPPPPVVAKTGTLMIESTPPGVEVRLDDEAAPPRGRTPLKVEALAPRSHVVFAKKSGFVAVAKAVTVGAGETVRLLLALAEVPPPPPPPPPPVAHVEPSPAPAPPVEVKREEPKRVEAGTLVVETTPPGAEVRLDDEHAAALGQTPLRLPSMTAGSHVLFLSKKGWRPVTKGTTVGAGETVRLELTLQAEHKSRALIAAVVVPVVLTLAGGAVLTAYLVTKGDNGRSVTALPTIGGGQP